MPVYRGAAYPRTFLFTDAAGAPVDITNWTFTAHFRSAKDAPDPPLITLTTGNGGWTVGDGPGGVLNKIISALQTDAIPADVGKLYFDVLRTDANPGPLWLFEGSVPVKDPVTRL